MAGRKTAKKVVFLDRDGVINKFPGNGNYVTKIKEFHFIPGSIEAIRKLTQAGYAIFVVSNQAGVGKGVYSQKKLDHITRNMIRAVKDQGGKIIKVFYCTHQSQEGCSCRKPRLGSVVKALKMVGRPMGAAKDAFFVGDTQIDIVTGLNSGCKTIFVLSGREDRQYLRRWKIRPHHVAKNLLSATKIILNNETTYSS